jgi:hypothetical protein
MRIDFDQEIWSSSLSLMPAGKVGCPAIQSGVPSSLFNRGVARIFTEFHGRASVVRSDDLRHPNRTLNR